MTLMRRDSNAMAVHTGATKTVTVRHTKTTIKKKIAKPAVDDAPSARVTKAPNL